MAALFDDAGLTVRSVVDIFSRDGPPAGLTQLAPGELLRTVREGFVYEVEAAGRPGPTLTVAGIALLPLASHGMFDVRQFGAVGDGTTDDTAALQLAIDMAGYGPERAVVRLPMGRFRITDTLHLGYGERPGGSPYTSITITGAGMVYRGRNDVLGGTLIVADFADRPALNVQGARNSQISRLSLFGRNYHHVHGNDMGAIGRPADSIDDTVRAAWVDPALPASAMSRYAPYAAITIDGYAGNAPDPAYPGAARPAWLGAGPAYGKAFSSNVRIAEVTATGFVAGLVVQPCDADGNGDFTTLAHCQIDHCVYAVSVGNSQSRAVGVEATEIHKCWCAFTTNTHGRQRGHLGSTISNVSLSHTMEVFRFGPSAWAGPLTFMNLYAESTWRLGAIDASHNNETAIHFITGAFKLTGADTVRGVPASVLDCGNAMRPLVRFTGCTFLGAGWFHFQGAPAVHDDTKVVRIPNIYWNRRFEPDDMLRTALAATASGVVVSGHGGGAVAGPAVVAAFRPYDGLTGLLAGEVSVGEAFAGAPGDILPIHARSIAGAGAASVAVPPLSFTLQPGAVTAVEVDDRTVRFTLSAVENTALAGAPQPGDLVTDAATGVVLLVRERERNRVSAEAQTGFVGSTSPRAGVRDPAALFTETATVVVARLRLLAPSTLARCTEGQAEVLLMPILDAPLSVGDALVTLPDPYGVFDGPAEIMALDARIGRLTLSEPARQTTDVPVCFMVGGRR
ncbi:MAG: glycosyl hydrolase family 28-related protein [Pseudomonadota bacterium]